MSMRKRIVRQVIAMVLCVCMALGLFDGIPVVKEYVRTSTEAEAAANPYVGTYNNCTWTAWKKAYELTGVQLPGFRGNAVGWYQGAINAGYTVSSVPREKSIAVWENTSYGHVAYVSKVSGGQIYVLEGGYGRNPWYHEGWCAASGKRAYTNDTLLGYIYLPVSNLAPINYQITTCGATNISNNDARILGSMSPAGNVNSWGFYVGPNTSAMAKITVSGQTYSGNMGCNIVNYYKLNYGTTYYYKIWAVVNGQEKQGGIVSFRTTATKPEIPSLKIASNYQNIGLESSATVNWNATRNTKYYKAYLYNSDNELIETSGQVTGTKYAFKAAQKVGTYHAKVEAYNEVGTKGKSNEVSFTVHPDVTVTFVDADSFVDVPVGTEPVELGKQTIHYGGTANAPADPEHTGYTFKKWSKSFSNVKEDIVVKAEYQINRYTVR